MSTNGSIPDVVPFYRYGNKPADPSWSSAFIFIIYSRYHISGDIRPYEKHCGGVELYLENMYRQYERRGGFEGMEKSGVVTSSCCCYCCCIRYLGTHAHILADSVGHLRRMGASRRASTSQCNLHLRIQLDLDLATGRGNGPGRWRH